MACLVFTGLLLASSLWPLVPALAQSATFPNRDESPGPERGRRGRGGSSAPAAAPTSILKAAPRQRLDPGALVCRSEAELKQHQSAVAARLDGRDLPEPSGCRLIGTMTAVNVVERHGLAATQVRLPGPPEQTMWTDAAIPQDK